MTILKRRPSCIVIDNDDDIIEICKGVYMGTSLAANDENSLIKNKITHIINLGSADKCYINNFQILRIEVDDNSETDILPIFPITNIFIECAVRVGCVFIHCRKGFSRSPAVIIAYLMQKNQWSYQEACSYISSKRHSYSMNEGFQEQLACYGESGYNIIKAEEIYHKKHYSKFLKEYNEINETEEVVKEMWHPNIQYYTKNNERWDVSLVNPLTYCYCCKYCKEMLIPRNRFFVHGWNHNNDTDLFLDLIAILDKSPQSDGVVTPLIDLDGISENSCTFLKFILQILYNGVSIGSEEQKKLVQSIESFEKCCNQWRDFRNNGKCDCFCDCTGWVRKQISKEFSQLHCPNPNCQKIIGESEIIPYHCPCGKSLEGKVILYWDCLA